MSQEWRTKEGGGEELVTQDICALLLVHEAQKQNSCVMSIAHALRFGN